MRKSKLRDACGDYNLRIIDGASFLSDTHPPEFANGSRASSSPGKFAPLKGSTSWRRVLKMDMDMVSTPCHSRRLQGLQTE